MEDSTLRLDEASARRLVLVRAIDDVDTQGKLLSEVERERLERDALEATRRATPSQDIDLAHYLQQRATRMLAAVENRNPQLAALREPEPWRRWAMGLVPLVACFIGAAIDRIDNPQQVNMLSPPLLGVVLWNLAVYALLAIGAFLPRRAQAASPLAGLQRWLAAAGSRARTGRLRTDVSARFHQQWLQATGARQALWWKQLLHLAAAGWAAGLALSIVIGGLVRQYRVGWESTLLDVHQVHAFLSVLFAPVVALLPFEAFTVADLQRMAFGAGGVGVDEARRWVWMYLALLAVLVIVPRLLLAAAAAWRGRKLASAVRIDLRDPYFVEVLARVSPARVTLGLVAPPGAARAQLLRALGEAADRPPPGGSGPWTVLTTSKGDVLRVFDIPAGFEPPPVAVPRPGGGPGAAQAWLKDLLRRFKAGGPVERAQDEVLSALADADLVLLVAEGAGELDACTRLLHWMARPALVLVPPGGSLEAMRSQVQRLRLAAQVLPLQAATAHWQREPQLLRAIAALLAPSKRAGFGRVAAAWGERGEERFRCAMDVLAALLLRAARDSEEVAAGPAGLRQWVDAGEREAGQRARDGASQALLQRLRLAEAGTFAELMRLYRLDSTPVALPAVAADHDAFRVQQAVDEPQAGMAGAATGAAMGAGIDLMTGGLTLGAAAALGAVIGGGAAYVAAAWKNRTAPSGQAQVQLGEDMLQALAESLLLRYLTVAHRDGLPGEDPPATWRSEVIAAVAGRRQELAGLWSEARGAFDDAPVQQRLARELALLARGLLGRL